MPSNAQLDLTTANEGHVHSEGTSTRSFPFNIKTPIHVFNDKDLHLSMHALSSFTNNPINGTVVLDKYGFKAYDSLGNMFCSGPKKEDDKLWFLPENTSYVMPNTNSSTYGPNNDLSQSFNFNTCVDTLRTHAYDFSTPLLYY